jgi:hypothetical protein
MVFSTRSVPTCYKQLAIAVGWWVSEFDNSWDSVVVSCRSEKLVDKAGDSSGTHRKGSFRRLMPLLSNG